MKMRFSTIMIPFITYLLIFITVIKAQRECGQDRTETGFPWIVYITNQLNNEYKCTGVLVAEQFVLTAVDCVLHEVSNLQLNERDLFVIAGHADLSRRPSVNQRSTIRRIIVHPFHALTKSDNYAFALLYLDLPLGSEGRSVCLPELQDNWMGSGGGVESTVMSWIRMNGSPSPVGSFLQMREINMKTWTTNECNEMFSSVNVEDTYLCVNGGDISKGQCLYDGGPVVRAQTISNTTTYTLIGIIRGDDFYKFGGCDLDASPLQVANVQYAMEWMNRVIYGRKFTFYAKCSRDIWSMCPRMVSNTTFEYCINHGHLCPLACKECKPSNKTLDKSPDSPFSVDEASEEMQGRNTKPLDIVDMEQMWAARHKTVSEDTYYDKNKDIQLKPVQRIVNERRLVATQFHRLVVKNAKDGAE